MRAGPQEMDNVEVDLPAWIHRWKSKLPDKLRNIVAESSGKEHEAPHELPQAPEVPAMGSASSSSSDLETELQSERKRRTQADIARQLAADEARRLQSEVWSLKAEVTRMHDLLRRLDISEASTLEDAESSLAMFTRLKREAEAIVADKRAAAGRSPSKAPSSPKASASATMPGTPTKRDNWSEAAASSSAAPPSPGGPTVPPRMPSSMADEAHDVPPSPGGATASGDGTDVEVGGSVYGEDGVEEISTEKPVQPPPSPEARPPPAEGADMDPPLDDEAFEGLQVREGESEGVGG